MAGKVCGCPNGVNENGVGDGGEKTGEAEKKPGCGVS
jgi:hypothetical protein